MNAQVYQIDTYHVVAGIIFILTDGVSQGFVVQHHECQANEKSYVENGTNTVQPKSITPPLIKTCCQDERSDCTDLLHASNRICLLIVVYELCQHVAMHS